MKRSLLLFCSAFLLPIADFAQVYSIDKGMGDFKRHSISITVIHFIEKNEPAKIEKYLAKNCLFDTASLDSNARYISILHPFENGISPGSFFQIDSNQNWYSRTYFERENGMVNYKAQIFIELIQVGTEYKVAKLEFRFGDKIIPIPNEIAAIDASSEDHNIPPPAPPAPPGFD